MNQTGNIVAPATPIPAKKIPDEIHHVLERNGTRDGAYNVCLTLDWNPHDFFKRKGVRRENGVLANTFTVTGDLAGGVAARGLEFLVRHFNCYAAVWTLELLDRIAEEYPVAWMAKERQRVFFARVRGHQTVIYLSTHSRQFIKDVGAILAWVGAAFHETNFLPLTYCTASMTDEGWDGHWSQLRISYELERVFPRRDHCWYDLFRATVIVRGYEHLVPRRSGLSMTEDVLIGLLGPAHIMVSPHSRALLRSKFALLIPTRFDVSKREMTWRLVRKEGNDAWDAELKLDEQDSELVTQIWSDEVMKIGPVEVGQINWHVVDGPRYIPGISE